MARPMKNPPETRSSAVIHPEDDPEERGCGVSIGVGVISIVFVGVLVGVKVGLDAVGCLIIGLVVGKGVNEAETVGVGELDTPVGVGVFVGVADCDVGVGDEVGACVRLGLGVGVSLGI